MASNYKNLIKSLGKYLLILWMVSFMKSPLSAQDKLTVGILNIETSGITLTPKEAGDQLRVVVEKTGYYFVADKWDMLNLMNKSNINADSCLGKSCLINVGKIAHADKMISGAIIKLDGNLNISLRLIDVNSGQVDKMVSDDYLYLPDNVRKMMEVSVAKLFGKPFDEEVLKKLSSEATYANTINHPEDTRLILNGPRMGFSLLMGDNGKRFVSSLEQGGYGKDNSVMFVFGYQQEVQYLNSGNFQALIEMVPAIVGLDKGLFIPSFSFLNGFRDSRTGWEFAFGPNFIFVKTDEGYYSDDAHTQWHQKDYTLDPVGTQYIKRLDKRGMVTLKTGFVVAAGKSFKSGKLNIPLNMYYIPEEGGARFGILFGFNAPKDKK